MPQAVPVASEVATDIGHGRRFRSLVGVWCCWGPDTNQGTPLEALVTVNTFWWLWTGYFVSAATEPCPRSRGGVWW